MNIRRLVFGIACIMLVTCILLTTASYPVPLVCPLLAAAGTTLIPLCIFEVSRLFFGAACSLLGNLTIIAGTVVFFTLGAAQFVPYLLIFLGLALNITGAVVLAKQ